jgi:hypothetical protein
MHPPGGSEVNGQIPPRTRRQGRSPAKASDPQLARSKSLRARADTIVCGRDKPVPDAPIVANSIVELRDVDSSKAVVRGDAHLRVSMGEGNTSLARI